MVTGTPSIDNVIFGEPALAFARIVNAVEAATLTVVDAVPPPTNANADSPEALRSATTRPDPAGDTTIFSASTLGVVVLDVAVAPTADRTGAASRRTAPSTSASAASTGVPPPRASESEARKSPTDVAGDTLAIGGDATRTAGTGERTTALTAAAGCGAANWAVLVTV